MKEAISYRRFSSGKQDKGDSKRRQDSAFTWFCQSHKLTPVETILDAGLSGFHAIHKSKGAFGVFLARVKAGAVKAGTVLVIEAWDRFSRERPDKALATLVEILEAGVHVGVFNMGEILTEADLDTPKMQMVYADMMRARQESKRKSEMSKAAKQERRDEGKVRTTICPSWLVPVVKAGDKAGKEGFTFHPLIAPLLRQAIDLAIAGHGGGAIRKRIGAVQVNGRNALVGLPAIFRQRTLIGEFQDNTRKGENRKNVSVPPTHLT